MDWPVSSDSAAALNQRERLSQSAARPLQNHARRSAKSINMFFNNGMPGPSPQKRCGAALVMLYLRRLIRSQQNYPSVIAPFLLV